MRGQDYRSSLFDNAQDGVPQSTTGFRVHACCGFILWTGNNRNSVAATIYCWTHNPLSSGTVGPPCCPTQVFEFVWTCSTDQEDYRWSSYESDGSRQFPHVSSTVAARWLVHIFDQAQLPDAPLCHLEDTIKVFTNVNHLFFFFWRHNDW